MKAMSPNQAGLGISAQFNQSYEEGPLMQLTDDEITILREIIAERLNFIPTRVEFDRTEITVRSVRLSKQMFTDAVAKAGGNFNKLVEHLIWNYLDNDVKYTKKTSKE